MENPLSPSSRSSTPSRASPLRTISNLSNTPSPSKRSKARPTTPNTNTNATSHLHPGHPSPPALPPTPTPSSPQPPTPATAVTEASAPTPPRAPKTGPTKSRTAKAAAITSWKKTHTSLTARVTATAAGVAPLAVKFTGQPASALSKSNSAAEDRAEYKAALGSLRGHACSAKQALEEIASAPLTCRSQALADKKIKAANKLTEHAVQSYEQEIAALADKLRVRSAHLGQEEAQLCAFLESAAAKFERWCEPGYEEKVVEAEGDGGGVVTLPHTVEVVEMKEMGQLGGMEPLNDASFYATQERDELQEEEEEEETRGDRMPRLEQVQAMSESQLKALAVKLDKLIDRDGGKTGHWHPDEHAVFLKAWTRCGKDSDKIAAAARQLGKTLEAFRSDEIVGHAVWLCTFEARQSMKKEVARVWRARKEKGREELLKKHEQEQRRKEEEGRKERGAGGGEEDEESRREKREAIRRWREQKLREKEETEMEKEGAEEEKKLRWERRQEEMLYQRARVNEFKAQKEEDRERDKRVKEMLVRSERVPALGKEAVERRRRKELEEAREKREGRGRKEREREEKEARLRGATKGAMGHVGRDASRLMGGTRAAEARAYSAEELDDWDRKKEERAAHDKPVYFSGRDLGLGGGAGKRAVPSWRKGM